MKYDGVVVKFVSWITRIEVLFCFFAPIHLWGWERGLLVSSGLTSLLHIVALLNAALAKSEGE